MALTKEKLQSLNDAFNHADEDGNGKIDFLEFLGLLEFCGMNIDTALAQTGFESVDNDNDGMIEFDEFMEWWSAN